jgi:spermidine/putrescine transport system ATP-binding protein
MRGGEMDAYFCLDGVSKRYGGVAVVDAVTVEVRRGEVFSILGPSGCGKTTLLRMAAGFAEPDGGRIVLEGEDITRVPPNRRRINTIFQNYALFPHMTVWENIAFGLKVAGKGRAEIASSVEAMLELIDLREHAKKKPGAISGGQKQRVAIARALVNRPAVLLLDEPLAALDLKLRQRMLLELDRIHDEVGTTFIYVTHDQSEAMSLSDRIAVMNEGRIEQVGSPVEIYEAPRSSFVAAFIGDTNFICGEVSGFPDKDYCELEVAGLGRFLAYNDKKVPRGESVTLSLRPEKLFLERERGAREGVMNEIRGRVEEIIYLGSQTRYWVRCGEYRLGVLMQHGRFLLDQRPVTWGEEVWVRWHADDGYMLQSYTEADEALLTVSDVESGEAAEEGHDAD